MKKKIKIGIIGLGYVGLPLAISFAKKYIVFGFEKNIYRINSLLKGIDYNSDIHKNDLNFVKNKLTLTNKIKVLSDCNVFIIAVPTPININTKPDLSFLINATKLISKILKKNDTVIYESTVYPGVTDNVCIPMIEKISGLTLNKDFYCGYSPERINPGDKKHKLENIIKITSGSNKYALNFIDRLYQSIIKAGTYRVSSIKVAEAAKVIENTQRDLNIALVNELSQIFNKVQIDTREVIDAAATKWNFMKFYPGLVGGHCIGIDPYYLTHLANKNDYKSKIILAGRKLNNQMPSYIAKELHKHLKNISNKNKNIKILIMGVTFKENCSDTRNSKVFILLNILNKLNYHVDIYDPLAKKISNNLLNSKNIIKKPKKNTYEAIIIAVGHDFFKNLGLDNIGKFAKKDYILFDLKGIFKKENSTLRL